MEHSGLAWGCVMVVFPIAQKIYVVVFCYKQARAPMEL